MAGLVPAIYVLLAEGRKKDVDARDDGVPAAWRGGVSLRGHDGGGVLPHADDYIGDRHISPRQTGAIIA
jgi:hypothetical protein